jgi:hypothetical protein
MRRCCHIPLHYYHQFLLQAMALWLDLSVDSSMANQAVATAVFLLPLEEDENSIDGPVLIKYKSRIIEESITSRGSNK